jgi:hypothetical protein
VIGSLRVDHLSMRSEPTRSCSSPFVLLLCPLLEVSLVALLSEWDCLLRPRLPPAGLVPGYQQNAFFDPSAPARLTDHPRCADLLADSSWPVPRPTVDAWLGWSP